MKDSEGNSYHALFRKGRENTVAEWLLDAINGDLKDYGTDLVKKKYWIDMAVRTQARMLVYAKEADRKR